MSYQPPHIITPGILRHVAEICELLGRLEGGMFGGIAPRLRRDNRIRTIQASLAIENNTLSRASSTTLRPNTTRPSDVPMPLAKPPHSLNSCSPP